MPEIAAWKHENRVAVADPAREERCRSPYGCARACTGYRRCDGARILRSCRFALARQVHRHCDELADRSRRASRLRDLSSELRPRARSPGRHAHASDLSSRCLNCSEADVRLANTRPWHCGLDTPGIDAADRREIVLALMQLRRGADAHADEDRCKRAFCASARPATTRLSGWRAASNWRAPMSRSASTLAPSFRRRACASCAPPGRR